MLRSLVLILSLLLAAPALAQTADDAAANRLFVEAVQLWNRAEGEPVEQRSATLQKVQANLKTIIDRHGGSALAVRLVIGETVGPLSVAGVERALRNPQMLLQPGKVFRDCPECPEMVVVPAGAASLASGRNVTIAAPFAVGKFEVTFAEWDACVVQVGCSHRPDDRGWGRGRQPVMNVNWDDALQYVAWLSRKTGKSYRLLSEAEWEYAAQAGSGREVAVTQGANEANCSGCGSRWDNRRTAPVGSFAPNAFGLHDMLGNVWEWTAESYRVLRGGSWNTHPEDTRSASRFRFNTDLHLDINGFRVARTL